MVGRRKAEEVDDWSFEVGTAFATISFDQMIGAVETQSESWHVRKRLHQALKMQDGESEPM